VGVIDYFKYKRDNLLLSQVFDSIERDRNGDQCDSKSVQDVLQSLIYCDKYSMDFPRKLYVEEFETPFIGRTREYYRNQSRLLMEKHPIKDYLCIVKERLEEEILRSVKFYDESSSRKVISECELALISEPSAIIYKEFRKFIESDNVQGFPISPIVSTSLNHLLLIVLSLILIRISHENIL
jgi:cullin 1